MIACAGGQSLAGGQVEGPEVQVRTRWSMTELPPIDREITQLETHA